MPGEVVWLDEDGVWNFEDQTSYFDSQGTIMDSSSVKCIQSSSAGINVPPFWASLEFASKNLSTQPLH